MHLQYYTKYTSPSPQIVTVQYECDTQTIFGQL